MAKTRTKYKCSECGNTTYKWQGRCSQCGEWNSFEEFVDIKPAASSRGSDRLSDALKTSTEPIPLTKVSSSQEIRGSVGISEFDRVLGGGLVPGSVVLVGGEPGIGKSTLLLQVAGKVADQDMTVLYCSGEESMAQIKMRAERLDVASDNIYLVTETRLEEIVRHTEAIKPDLLIVDSIQTTASTQITSSSGSVSQLREVTNALVALAKGKGMPLFLVGHVTKGGNIAGPKMLEHMVDTVLYFEGQQGVPFRLIRAVKNRFGSTNEIGVFEMRSRGLQEVTNPSGLLLSERPDNVPGSAVMCTFEGTRPLLAEIQALVSPNNYGPPRVTAIGVDTGRVLLMLNILERYSGLKLLGHDVFVNVAGGLKFAEPAVDLGIIAALASSKIDQAIPHNVVVFGEVGLSGEVRAVIQASQRLTEVNMMGFTHCVMARNSVETLKREGERLPENVELSPVSNVRDVLNALFGPG